MNLKDALEKAMTKNPEAGERIREMLAEADRETQETVPLSLKVIEMPEHPGPDDDLCRDDKQMERQNRLYQPKVREGYYLIDCVRFADAFYAETQKPDRLVTSHPHIEVETLLAGWETWEIPTIDVNLHLYEWGWHTIQVVSDIGGGRVVATITGPMFNGEVVLLKAGIYPQDYPQYLDPNDIVGPVLGLPDIQLAASEIQPGSLRSRYQLPKPSGYDEITIAKRRYYFHSSKAGVEALFRLTGVRLLANRLMVWPGQAGAWIGVQGFNAKRLAKLLGLRYLQIVAAEE